MVKVVQGEVSKRSGNVFYSGTAKVKDHLNKKEQHYVKARFIVFFIFFYKI